MKDIKLSPDKPLKDYQEAMRLADARAETELGEYMLLSWYDRDRDFESPQHSSATGASAQEVLYAT